MLTLEKYNKVCHGQFKCLILYLFVVHGGVQMIEGDRDEKKSPHSSQWRVLLNVFRIEFGYLWSTNDEHRFNQIFHIHGDICFICLMVLRG